MIACECSRQSRSQFGFAARLTALSGAASRQPTPSRIKSTTGVIVGAVEVGSVMDEGAGPERALCVIILLCLVRCAAMQFILNNWPLILVLVVSGGMLVWPLVQRYLSSGREIGALAATQLINRQNAVVLDLRETNEYEGGRVPNAVHIPLSQLAGRGKELAKFTARPVIAYCDRGNRSRTATSQLTKLGFTEVFTLHGGLRAWSEAGMPLEKGS
jgi:rhodanese-related sulfurtransferase